MAAPTNGPKPSPVPTPKSLTTKLAEVMAAVGPLTKTGYNEHHHYKYVEEATVMQAVRSELAQRHVMIYPTKETIERIGSLTQIHSEYLVQDGDTLQSIVVESSGTGNNTDKGLYAAKTGAMKYLLTKLFLIPTGDDVEQHPDIEPSTRIVSEPVALEERRPWVQATPASPSRPPLAPPELIKKAQEAFREKGREPADVLPIIKEHIGASKHWGSLTVADCLDLIQNRDFYLIAQSQKAEFWRGMHRKQAQQLLKAEQAQEGAQWSADARKERAQEGAPEGAPEPTQP